MNHKEAIELGAAEKYVLRELPDEGRDAYEDHFFDCAECAADIRALAGFADGGKEVYEGLDPRRVAENEFSKPESVWTRWLRPVIAVPAFAALLLIVGYQNLSTIPNLRKSASADSVQLLRSFPLAQANTRGGSALDIPVRPGESFSLKFDIPPMSGVSQYSCQLQDASGRVLRQINVDVKRANKTVELLVPGGMIHPGTYYVVIAGDSNESAQIRKEDRLADLGFEVKFEN
jgi:hypothetical protein